MSASVSDADVAIQDERSAKLFGECELGHGLLEFGVCQVCQPEAHAKLREMALAVERERIDAARRANEERNKPIAALADLIETRRDSQHYAGMCEALRKGYATDLQIKLARRLTTAKALKRTRRTS